MRSDCLSKIRLFRSRACRLLSVIVDRALGADVFLPLPSGALIGDLSRPRHGEEDRILDRELKLQSLAVGGVDVNAPWATAKYFQVALGRHFGFCGVDQAVALDQMQSLALRRAEGSTMVVGPTLMPTVSMTSVSPAIDRRIAHRRRRRMFGMRGVQAHTADLVIRVVEDGDLILVLQHLQPLLVREDIGRRMGRALVGRVGKIDAAERRFASLFHDGRGFWLQYPIGVIANVGRVVEKTVLRRWLHSRHGSRPGGRLLVTEGTVRPCTGEIRRGRGVFNAGRGLNEKCRGYQEKNLRCRKCRIRSEFGHCLHSICLLRNSADADHNAYGFQLIQLGGMSGICAQMSGMGQFSRSTGGSRQFDLLQEPARALSRCGSRQLASSVRRPDCQNCDASIADKVVGATWGGRGRASRARAVIDEPGLADIGFEALSLANGSVDGKPQTVPAYVITDFEGALG